MFRLPALRSAFKPAATTTLSSSSTQRAFSASAQRAFARLTVVGNLGAKPEIRTTSNGREVVNFVIASNSGSRENPYTSWFRVSSFNERIRDFLTSLDKGSLVLVEGDATLAPYTVGDRKVHTLNVVEKTVRVLKRGRSEEEREGEGEGQGEADAES